MARHQTNNLHTADTRHLRLQHLQAVRQTLFVLASFVKQFLDEFLNFGHVVFLAMLSRHKQIRDGYTEWILCCTTPLVTPRVWLQRLHGAYTQRVHDGYTRWIHDGYTLTDHEGHPNRDMTVTPTAT